MIERSSALRILGEAVFEGAHQYIVDCLGNWKEFNEQVKLKLVAIIHLKEM